MAFEALKERQAQVWNSADFEQLAATAVDIHGNLLSHLGVNQGERWLDTATGTGAVAIRAARLGAVVVGTDFAGGLLATARRRAVEEGVTVTFQLGDCEALPFADSTFDVVCSAQGAVFAPDHAAVARETIRVCRPGGRIGMTAWRPGGSIEAFMRLVGRFMPPPPPGAGNPMDWGRPDYVEGLLGQDFSLEFFEGESPQLGTSPEALWGLFCAAFGPIAALAATLDETRRAELHDAFVRFYEGYLLPDGSVSAPREYVVIVGRPRG